MGEADHAHIGSVGCVANAWDDLAGDYEHARHRQNSFDRLLEWPTQRAALGDIPGQRILDVGCGSGAKALALADAGAAAVIGVAIAGKLSSTIAAT
jgi:2-polyprenyl-3-methyl-5-hydroxy-6-metoxy-1,4-benzoquinol methylase